MATARTFHRVLKNGKRRSPVRLPDLPILTLEVQDSDPSETLKALPTKLDPNGTKVCIALGGCSGGINACSIHEQRPRACRVFAVGGYFCQDARRRFGFPV